jgi:NitT/TauT family transport system substrate-binding protein
LLIGRADYIEKHPDVVQKFLAGHDISVEWINQNPDQTESTFIQFYKAHTGKTLDSKIVHNSFSQISFTNEIDSEAISLFAERAYSLGYLGRHGYTLDDIYAQTLGVIQWQS